MFNYLTLARYPTLTRGGFLCSACSTSAFNGNFYLIALIAIFVPIIAAISTYVIIITPTITFEQCITSLALPNLKRVHWISRSSICLRATVEAQLLAD